MFGVSSIFGEGLAPVRLDAQHQGKHYKFGKGYRKGAIQNYALGGESAKI